LRPACNERPLQISPDVYRLVAFAQTSSDYHDSLNSVAAKATFYVLHILPEWLVVAMYALPVIRRVCQTGRDGDRFFKDETPEEREARLEYEKKTPYWRRFKCSRNELIRAFFL
jgi:hypothetical protein